MYAIIRSGGKQFRVQENNVVRLELLDAEVGSQVELNDIALIGGADQTLVGQPLVEGARVLGKVVAHGRTRRIVVFKYKPKKGYHRRKGHRQHYHDVMVQQILGPGEEPRKRQQREAAPASVESAPSEVVEVPVSQAPVFEEPAMDEAPTELAAV